MSTCESANSLKTNVSSGDGDDDNMKWQTCILITDIDLYVKDQRINFIHENCKNKTNTFSMEANKQKCWYVANNYRINFTQSLCENFHRFVRPRSKWIAGVCFYAAPHTHTHTDAIYVETSNASTQCTMTMLFVVDVVQC